MLAKNAFGVVLLLIGFLLLNMGCSSTPKNLGSLARTKEEDRYDFYISLLDDTGEPSRTYIVRGFSEQAKAQFYGNLNSVIINDKSEILYALVVDKDIEYRRHVNDLE